MDLYRTAHRGAVFHQRSRPERRRQPRYSLARVKLTARDEATLHYETVVRCFSVRPLVNPRLTLQPAVVSMRLYTATVPKITLNVIVQIPSLRHCEITQRMRNVHFEELHATFVIPM